MASSSKTMLAIFLCICISINGAFAEIICEELPNSVCSFAIASSGKRCLLENTATNDGQIEYQCRTSEVVVGRMAEYIETDSCVEACGADRNAVGISSDSLMEPQFTAKLCSPSCFQNCPNIVNLYLNLAAGEGVYLPDLCKAQRLNPRREMPELMSSGAAEGPDASPLKYTSSEGPAVTPLSYTSSYEAAAPSSY